MLTDIEIAQQAKLRPIGQVAASLNIPEEDLEYYGKYKAKISDELFRSVQDRSDGKLILLTAINPTPAGEGKTTTSIGLGEAMTQLGKKAVIALREPSLGPVFGIKGGAAGGGYSQVVPMEDINLHFTGDMHAITAANNLLCAMLDNHMQQGNALGIDPRRILVKRCLDMNDRALRNTVIGLGGKVNGVPREDGFIITVASEIMAILCLADDLMDLKRRLDMERPDVVMLKYAVGYDGDGAPSFFFYRERLLRRCGKAVWKGRIHEAVEPFGKVVREDIMIEHRKVGIGDPDRNLRIFEQMLREKGKLSPRDQYYYGKELYYHRRYRDAASVFSEYLELPDGWREDRVDAGRHGAYCMYRIGDRDRALKFLLSGLSEGIPKPELCCDLGWWFFSAGRCRDAIFWYGQAVRTGRWTGEDGFVMPEYRGYVPYLQMCVCYDRLGEWKTAERYNELAERCRPGTEACRLNREYFEKRKAQQIERIQ